MTERLTAIIEREGATYVALCPEFDIASQGDTIESARENLCEAVELFFECAAPEEFEQRRTTKVFVTQVEMAVGEMPRNRRSPSSSSELPVMSPSLSDLGIDRLTIPERLELIGRIWDTLPPDTELPIPDWHIRELGKRLAAADADPGAAIPWETVKARMADES